MRPTLILRQTISPQSKEGYQKALAAAEALVRRGDPEAIYASYFYPGHLRPAYLALKAFNVELAGLQDQVSNQIVGRMRYQWWKDAIKGVYDVSCSIDTPRKRETLMLIRMLEQAASASVDDAAREFASTKLALSISFQPADQRERSPFPQPDLHLAPRSCRLQRGHAGIPPIPPPPSDGGRFCATRRRSPTCETFRTHWNGTLARRYRRIRRSGTAQRGGRSDARSRREPFGSRDDHLDSPEINPSSRRETSQRDSTRSW